MFWRFKHLKIYHKMIFCSDKLIGVNFPFCNFQDGRTPMHYTATYGTESGICEKLMARGGDPCCQDKVLGIGKIHGRGTSGVFEPLQKSRCRLVAFYSPFFDELSILVRFGITTYMMTLFPCITG